MSKYQELARDDDMPLKPYSFHTLFRKKWIHDRWEYQADDNMPLLRRVLTRVDIHSYGLCMTIGAGIFVYAGAVAQGVAGPAVVLSFLFSGIAALIASFSYSEFAARVPACGSTYSYVYVSLGEFMGWMAGWITIMEYAGAATVAHGIANMIIKINESFQFEAETLMAPNNPYLNKGLATSLVCMLTFFVLFIGVKGSARFCRIMSFTNISTIVFICIAGSMSVQPPNWNNFAPKGFPGIIEGAARVFFAYIGFENSTTLATEVKNPKKYMPGGVIMTLVTAITLYMVSSLVITGMIPFEQIDTVSETPFVNAFQELDVFWAAVIVGIGSLLCMTATILTMLVGLPRILYQMSKDGLLGEFFSRLNKFKVPFIGTVVFGAIACAMAFIDLSTFRDMVCVGMLINYSLMNLSVIALRFLDTERKMEKRHMVALGATIFSCILVALALNTCYYKFLAPICLIPFLLSMIVIARMFPVYSLANPPIDSFLTPFVPFLPCCGILMNIIMIAQLGIDPFWQVSLWLGAGAIVYFAYGMRHSRLNFIKSTDRFYY